MVSVFVEVGLFYFQFEIQGKSFYFLEMQLKSNERQSNIFYASVSYAWKFRIAMGNN